MSNSPLTDANSYRIGSPMGRQRGPEHLVVDYDLASRMERDRAELMAALQELLEQVDSLDDYTLTRDTETYKAQAVWDATLEQAWSVLTQMKVA